MINFQILNRKLRQISPVFQILVDNLICILLLKSQIGVICEVTDYERLDSGRINIEVVGLRRFLVEDTTFAREVEKTTGVEAEYCIAKVKFIDDIHGSTNDARFV